MSIFTFSIVFSMDSLLYKTKATTISGTFAITNENSFQIIPLGNFLGGGSQVELSIISSSASQSSVIVSIIRVDESFSYFLEPSLSLSEIFTFDDCCEDIAEPVLFQISFYAENDHENASGVFSLHPWPVSDLPVSDIYFSTPNPGPIWILSFTIILAGSIPLGIVIIIISMSYRKKKEN